MYFTERILTENNEKNNSRKENWKSDITAPEIISGPTVSEITQNSAVISWETNELTKGLIKCGMIAGKFSLDIENLNPTKNHTITIKSLKPSTTYHFFVKIIDLSDNTVESKINTFETLSLPDGIDPVISIIDTGTFSGISKFTTHVNDNMMIEKVNYYINENLVFADYSYPYELEIISSIYENGEYFLIAEAYDVSGRSASDEQIISFLNIADVDTPTVVITFPKLNNTVSEKINITADLKDDKALADALLYMDGTYIMFEPLPANTTIAEAKFVYDTRLIKNGKHRIGIKVYDCAGKSAIDEIDVFVNNLPPPPQPMLYVKNHKVTRIGNSFLVSISIENKGAGIAKNIAIQDFLKAFQPVSQGISLPKYSKKQSTYSPSNIEWNCFINDNTDLPVGDHRTYMFEVVPVLFNHNPPQPSIGHSIKLFYEGSDGFKHEVKYYVPVYNTTDNIPLKVEFNNALKESDYLLITNPQRLFLHYYSHEVNELLGDMAQLAFEKKGVLGFINDYNEVTIRNLIKPGGEWSKKLDPKFNTPLGGYLLLVGETEILPAWNNKHFSCCKEVINYSDHPYSDADENGKPDLIVGRLIGDDAFTLANPIKVSLGVNNGSSGFAFSRDNALLLSGTPPRVKFIKNVNNVEKILQNEFNVEKIHFNDFFNIGSIKCLYEKGDCYVLGDVQGDKKDELIIGSINTDKIYIYKSDGKLLSSFFCGSDNKFDPGDQIAVGNTNIVMVDISSDKIFIYNMYGLKQKSFTVEFDLFDDLVVADVTGSKYDEIIIADKSTDTISFYTNSGIKLHDAIKKDLEIDDDVIVGDLWGTNKKEIILTDKSENKLFVYTSEGIQLCTFEPYYFLPQINNGVYLASGNVYGLKKEQILLASTKEFTGIFPLELLKDTVNSKYILDPKHEIPYELNSAYGLTTGEFDGVDGEVYVSRVNQIQILDAKNFLSRIKKDFPNRVINKDVIYWFGHGNKSCWNDLAIDSYALSNSLFPLDFNKHNPVIFAASCVTGNYQDGGDFDNKNIAESFMASGASMYPFGEVRL